ncbi:MAG: hypothetical protein JWQ35_1413 [Bacteriovoracaceae bacterium]|nr:hypothetical protein [Bacteriovoracaceae bacterium]
MRIKFFIAGLLFLTIVGGVAFFKIDTLLTTALEEKISQITLTKTDISNLKVSFKNWSLEIKKLEVASRDDEFKNIVELEGVFIGFKALPLLKKTLFVDEFSIKGISFGTPRGKSGKLSLPKKSSSWVSEKMGNAIDKIKAEFVNLPFNKFLDFEIPSDPIEMVNALNLKSIDVFKTSISNMEQYRGDLSRRMSELRGVSDYDERINEARNLAKNTVNDPKVVSEAVETIKKTYEFFQAEQRKAESLFGDASSDIRKAEGDLSVATNALELDFAAAKSRVSLDEFDIGNLSKIVFGSPGIDLAEKVIQYHSLLQKSLVLNTEDGEFVEVKKRQIGRDIIFIDEKAQPRFVLENSEFNVKSSQAAYTIKMKDINSAPFLYGKPSSLELKGSFENAPLGSASFASFWDYTKKIPKDDLHMEVDQLKAEAWPLGIPKIFPIKFSQGSINAESKLHFDGEAMKWVSEIFFKNISWDFSELPQAGLLVSAMKDVLSSTKYFHVDIEMISDEKGLQYHVKSDLDELLHAAIQSALQKKIESFQEKLHLELEKRVSVYKDQANKNLSDLRLGTKRNVEQAMDKANQYREEAGKLEQTLTKRAQSGVASIPALKNPSNGIKNPF